LLALARSSDAEAVALAARGQCEPIVVLEGLFLDGRDGFERGDSGGARAGRGPGERP
jgi:hypothetical protein